MANSGTPPPVDFWGSLERRVHAEWLVVTAFMLVLTVLLSYFNAQIGTDQLDRTFYDKVLNLTAQPKKNDDIAVITIDDGSIAQLGYWPWRRAVHAQLLDHLPNARAIGFDILFSDRNPAYPHDDTELAQAIERHGRVVLADMIADDLRTIMQPLPELARAAADSGYINIYPDDDGIIRSIVLRQELKTGDTAQHLLLDMLDVAGQPAASESALPPGKPLLIPYGPHRFTLYPYASVLEGRVPPHTFDGKFVLIGSWGSGLGDAFPTPLTREGNNMAGVEILANGLASIINDTWIWTPDAGLMAILSCLPVLLVFLAFRRLSPRRSLLIIFIALFAVFAICALFMRLAGIWFPITASLIGLILAYPIWSWRSQEVSLRHLDRELDGLQLDSHALGEALPAKQATRTDGSLPARIAQLHSAISRLRKAQKRRDETLRFLSHDMRSPQNSILALIQLQKNSDSALAQPELLDRVNQYAHKTLDLVDGFVRLARAEAMKLQQGPVDLVQLAEQCRDEFWAQATQRGIRIVLDELPESAWVEGDAGLLERAWCNLMDNALKYSPDRSVIRCSIRRSDEQWAMQIMDQGRGIPADKLGALFQPFGRVDADLADSPAGAGLGLAFVKTVAQRHQGSISVQSTPGVGTEFTLCLPADQSHGR